MTSASSSSTSAAAATSGDGLAEPARGLQRLGEGQGRAPVARIEEGQIDLRLDMGQKARRLALDGGEGIAVEPRLNPARGQRRGDRGPLGHAHLEAGIFQRLRRQIVGKIGVAHLQDPQRLLHPLGHGQLGRLTLELHHVHGRTLAQLPES